MKICTIIGARPQFIKAGALSRILQKEHNEILIHTGQHYDRNMSEVFFEELDIPTPFYNLGISGGTHAHMTGQMLMAIEDVLLAEKPQMVLVYGDANSTLAGALAAVKQHIAVCHVEAGIRIKTFISPEEVNRVLVDRISSLLFCCTHTGINNLAKEGIVTNVHNVGDLMYDAMLYYNNKPNHSYNILSVDGKAINLPEMYYYLTCHREENTSTDKPLYEILSAMNMLDFPTIYPVHPRNRKRAIELCLKNNFKNIILTEPVGYKTSLFLVSQAYKIVTDSGGLQREAYFLDKQCITLLTAPPWPETLEGNINQLCKPLCSEILSKINVKPDFTKKTMQFGNGRSAEQIVSIIGQL